MINLEKTKKKVYSWIKYQCAQIAETQKRVTEQKDALNVKKLHAKNVHLPAALAAACPLIVIM